MISLLPPSKDKPVFPIVPISASTETPTECAISTTRFVMAMLSLKSACDASIITEL